MIENFNVVVVENCEFEKLNEFMDNIFGIFGLSRIGNKKKKHAHYGLCDKLTARISENPGICAITF